VFVDESILDRRNFLYWQVFLATGVAILFDILIISFPFTFKDFLPASGDAGVDTASVYKPVRLKLMKFFWKSE
jgi:hypothetical protein